MADHRSNLLFSIAQGILSWQSILGSKSAKLAYTPTFVALAFQNGSEYCNSNFIRFSGDDLVKMCKNLLNFGPVTPEFTRVIGAHSSSISSLATFTWRGATAATKFYGTISTQFCFSYSLVCRAGYTLGSAVHFQFYLCSTSPLQSFFTCCHFFRPPMSFRHPVSQIAYFSATCYICPAYATSITSICNVGGL